MTGRGANGRRAGPRVVDLDVPAPADLPDSRSRVTAFRLALTAAVLAAVAALVVWLRRRRSTADE